MSIQTTRRALPAISASAVTIAALLLAAGVGTDTASAEGWPAEGNSRGVVIPTPLPTTPNDFFEKGTQPNTIVDPIASFDACAFCHYGFDGPSTLPGRWVGSLHAHSARDPLFLAAVAIANQDAPTSGGLCFRCHSPRAWLEGRATSESNPDGSGLFPSDRENGVNCNACHRIVNPVFEAGVSPEADEMILDDLALNGFVPNSPGNAQYVIDPLDVRRGPRDYAPGDPEPLHQWAFSDYHRRGDLCGTCHNVSNPVFNKQPDGTYAINTFDEAHPTGDTGDMFPEQTTFSEWAASAYAAGGIDSEGRFGGNNPVVSKCQDCHQPNVNGPGCGIPGYASRNDLAYHSFQGANRWMIDVLLYAYEDNPIFDEEMNLIDPGLSGDAIDQLEIAKGETEYMLEAATDLEVTQVGAGLQVRVINQCGHKLLTGMPEGTRIWLNVQFFDAKDNLIGERGAYDVANADLVEDTKVYERISGIDAAVASMTGLTEGPSFHLLLNNVILKDNRIPPRGFTNAAYEAFGGQPVGYSYADGQYWDDTFFAIPAGTASARVVLNYQTASKEYIEFLRDGNVTNNAGDFLYDAWENTNKAAPFPMDDLTTNIVAFLLGDTDNDGLVGLADLNTVLGNFGSATDQGPLAGDVDFSGFVDLADLNIILGNFGNQL